MQHPIVSFDINNVMRDALAAHQRGEFVFAAERYLAVLRVSPQHAAATHFLGLLEHQRGHTKSALSLLQHALEIDPANVLYLHNLAGVYKELNRYTEATTYYKRAIDTNPEYVDSLVGLATVLLDQGDHAAALEYCRRALVLSPTNVAALEKKGEALHGLGREPEAVAIYHQILRTVGQDSKILHIIGMALHAAGADDDAISCLRKAITLNPGSHELYNSLGIVLGDTGNLEGAETSYRNALRLNPLATDAIHNLVHLVPLRPDDALWASLVALTKHTPVLPPNEAIPLQFALGTWHEQNGDYTRAFEHFLRGNQEKRIQIDYDQSRQMRFYRLCGQILNPGNAPDKLQPQCAHDSVFTPIFIVGFSRSGTTLVEQILSSHSQVYGAGEIQHLWCAVRTVLNISARDDDDVPLLLAGQTAEVWRQIATRYRSALTAMAPTAIRITDKLSGNAPLVGFIHAVFPDAKIIHCTRDPLDTCVSCFSKLFVSGHLFSYDLGELGRFYRLFENLMQHWDESLEPSCILEMRYEDIVNDLEGQTKRLLRFCDLPWDPNCLRYYETRRSVRTASLTQVHRPIYTSSIGRWRHYDQYLDPLKQALAEQIP